MGLFDFFRKGEEKPAQPQAKPKNTVSASKPVARQQVHQPRQAMPQKKYYTVKSGDSLSRIAKQVYGDANAWHKIHHANTDQIKDPNLIHPGLRLIIPQ